MENTIKLIQLVKFSLLLNIMNFSLIAILMTEIKRLKSSNLDNKEINNVNKGVVNTVTQTSTKQNNDFRKR